MNAGLVLAFVPYSSSNAYLCTNFFAAELKVHQLLPNTISSENYTFTLLDFQWSLCLKLEVVSGQLVTPWPCRTWCISYTTFKCTKFLYRYGCFEGSSVKLVQRTCSETETNKMHTENVSLIIQHKWPTITRLLIFQIVISFIVKLRYFGQDGTV